MNLDVDFLINFFEKNTKGKNSELDEQDAGAGGGGGGGSTGKGNNPSKWSVVVGGPKRGVANSLPVKGQTWSSIHGGPQRGPANKLGTA